MWMDKNGGGMGGGVCALYMPEEGAALRRHQNRK